MIHHWTDSLLKLPLHVLYKRTSVKILACQRSCGILPTTMAAFHFLLSTLCTSIATSSILQSRSSTFSLLYFLLKNCKISKLPPYDIKEIQIFGVDFFFSSPYFNLVGLIILWINCEGKLILHRKCHSALIGLNLNAVF